MSNYEERNRPCPECRKNGQDSTGDHLYLHENKKIWLCTRVHHHDNKQYYIERVEDSNGRSVDESSNGGSIGSSDSNNTASIDDILKPPPKLSSGTIEFRGIPSVIWKRYGVEMSHEIESKRVHEIRYPMYTHCGSKIHKVRVEPKEPGDKKKFFWSEEMGDRKVYFFGQDKVGHPKKLLITEGVDDAPAAQYMLSKYPNVKVVALTHGANIKSFIDNFEWLSGIEDITYDPDHDDAGEKIVAEIAELLPKIKIMKKSLKDAGDMLKDLKGEEYVRSYYEAKRYTHPSIIEVTDDLIEEAITPVGWGLSLPWENVTRKTFGLITPQVIGIGGAPGSGKTTFVQDIQSHLMDVHNETIGVADLETVPGFSLRKLIGYILGLKIHTPDTPYPPEKVEEARQIGRKLKGRVVFYRPKGNRDFDKVMDGIRWMVKNGIKYVFVDPLSGLVAHLNASDGNEYLNSALFTLGEATQDLGFTVFHVNHLNNPKGTKDHSEGARVSGGQFTGSKAMWKFSTDLWGLERNQQEEDTEKKKETTLRIIKHRLDGNTGPLTLIYDKITNRYYEKDINPTLIGKAKPSVKTIDKITEIREKKKTRTTVDDLLL